VPKADNVQLLLQHLRRQVEQHVAVDVIVSKDSLQIIA
jgi:hypothetical protein